jgi:HD superfamily phosphohydrolase
MKIYEIRDPVYGFIRFNEWEREIINHPTFQRLRRIRQLGFTDMVYPGAVHTRFEHSLGVMHLITKMYDSILLKNENKEILNEHLKYDEAGFKRDRQLIRLAGLLHDIGHPPFSHVSEELFPKNPQTDKPYSHEDYTVAIITGPLKETIENHPINKNNYNIRTDEIAAVIIGNPNILGKRIFWKILISSQLDADRCDYLLRDSLHIGVKYGIYDLDRLLVTLRLGEDPEKDITLGIEEGGWHVSEQVVIARYQMFTQVYYHKTRRAYDYMLKQALKNAIDTYPPPNEINDFLALDDYNAVKLMLENNEWFNKVLKREHIRMVLETEDVPSKEEKVEKFKEKLRTSGIWFWEDCSEDAKNWYDMESEEIQIIDEVGNVKPLSQYSKIVHSLKMRFNKIRIYVKFEEKEKAKKLKKEVYHE